jgi:prevent-host-death family protein
MKTITATSARANLFGLIDQVTEENEEVMITTKRKNVVMVSEEDWRSIQETLYLSSIPGMVESIKEANNEPLEERLSEEEFFRLLEQEEDDD